MPLAHTAYRPHPEVELLDTRPISIEGAVASLEVSLRGDDSGKDEGPSVPGSSLVNYRHIPAIVESLKSDWMSAPAGDVPGKCFVEVHGRLEAHLSPCFMGERLIEGMRGAVGGLLMRYSVNLGCVPIGFKRLEPAGTHAALVAESPYVHFLIDFQAVGFVPRQGNKLVGRMSDVQTAIGVNVKILNFFNCFVRKADLPADAKYDAESGKWMVGEGEGRRKLGKKTRPMCVQVLDPIAETMASSVLSFRGYLCRDDKPGRPSLGGQNTNDAENTSQTAVNSKRKPNGGDLEVNGKKKKRQSKASAAQDP